VTGLAALALADARFPGGGHAHSGGIEEAVARGLVRDVDDLGSFLLGRLRTAGLVAAAFAAQAARTAAGTAGPGGGADRAPVRDSPGADAELAGPGGGTRGARMRDSPGEWAVLDAELDARTPSPAQRAASRAQGRAALRAARLAWPSPALDALVAVHARPHHPLLVGAVIAEPADAARCVAYLSVSGPASAAVRLLGLDPLAVNAVLVGLPVDAVAERARDGLPATGSPGLDLMAEAHVQERERVRLFVS
jgi:urease accessory protein